MPGKYPARNGGTTIATVAAALRQCRPVGIEKVINIHYYKVGYSADKNRTVSAMTHNKFPVGSALLTKAISRMICFGQ